MSTPSSVVTSIASRSWRRVAAIIVLPVVLYVVLRPENFGLTPNALDPFFYTGYAINLDDLLTAVGDRHYFVSRWSAYLPVNFIDRLIGPFAGRLLWRLVLAQLILVSLWGLGRRLRWSFAQVLLVGTLVLTMPIFVRAFFTDYVEYIVVALGVCLVAMCLRERHTPRSAAAVGAVAGLVIVANPISISLVALCIVTASIVGANSLAARMRLLASIGLGFAAVVVAGLVWFRWRYGIDNVYAPSIEFIKTRGAVADDPWKDSRLLWLARFTWLFAPPILVVATNAIARRRAIRLERLEVAALVLCAAQYGAQWFDQFARGGYGLEVSFYWSFAYAPFAVALAVMVARFTKGARTGVLVVMGVCWLAFLLIGVADAIRLPAGWGFALLSLAIIAGAVCVARRSSVAAAVVLTALVGWTQIGAPRYDASAHTPLNVDPKYDELFRRAGDASEVRLGEAIWFSEQMDRVANDANASFAAVGGWAGTIVGVYAPHVVGRLVGMEPDGHRLSAAALDEIIAGSRPVVAVYGPPDDVAAMMRTIAADVEVGSIALDETHRGGLGYRLVVYQMPDASQLPFTWSPAVLPIANGRLIGAAVVADQRDAVGFVTYGPYVALGPGHYRVTLRYRGSASASTVVGRFDVTSADVTGGGGVALAGTGDADALATVEFDVVRPSRWEFRTSWTGAGDFAVLGITLAG